MAEMCPTCPHRRLLISEPLAEVDYKGVHPCHEDINRECEGHLETLARQTHTGTNGDIIRLHLNGVVCRNEEEWLATARNKRG